MMFTTPNGLRVFITKSDRTGYHDVSGRAMQICLQNMQCSGYVYYVDHDRPLGKHYLPNSIITTTPNRWLICCLLQWTSGKSVAGRIHWCHASEESWR